MNFLRQKYKEKPQAWGSFDSVQRSLFINAEKIGINPADIALAMPMWNPGNQIDYSRNNHVGINTSASFLNNELRFNGASSNIAISDHLSLRLSNNFAVIQNIKATAQNAYSQSFSKYSYTFSDNHESAAYDGVIATYNSSNIWVDGNGSIEIPLNIILSVCCNFKQSQLETHINIKTKAIKTTAVNCKVTTNPFVIGCGLPTENTNTINNFFTGLIYQTIVFKVSLSDSQIALLSDNPYQLWQRQPDIYFSIAASGSGGIYFLLSLFNETIASNINISILRTIITNISNSSNTSDISVSINQLISLLLNIGNSTDCSDIVNSISRALRVDLSNSSDTSIIIQNITRNINTSFTNQTITSGIVHSVTRLLTALISNSSLLSDITVNMSNLVSLIMAMSNQSITSEIQASITRLLQLAILNNTNQSNIAISILRSLSATINNQTIANDINILLANLIQFGMTVSNSTALSDIITKITRDLIVNTTNTTDTSDIDYSILRTFLTNISNQTELSEIDVQILRSLSAILTNSTVTPDTLRLIMGIIGSLINISSVVSANQYSAKVIPTNQYSANIFTNIYTGEIING